jgi:predicted dehydrogenase|tara:strand:+ start:69 stop:1046 length:978 start_codon:yes stop_codon:yes gene_type:complete
MKRIGVVGCGLIGHKRADAFRRLGHELAWCHDLDPAAATSLKADHEGASAVASLDEALERGDADLVVVAVDHASLVPVASAAVAAGHDVLVEKPGAVGLGQILELVEVTVASGRTVRVGYNHRFHPSLLEARKVVGGGNFGPVLHVRARYGHGGRVGYESEWRAKRSLSGGGELVDQGVHLIDLTRFLCGDAELAFAELRTDYWAMDVEDNAFLALRCDSGAFAWLHASWTEWKNLFSFEVVMERAKIEITGLGGSYGVERYVFHEMLPEMGPPVTTTREWPPGDHSWDLEVEDVLAACTGGETIGASLDDAVAVWRIVEEANRR